MATHRTPSTWHGFLPKGALIMARHRGADAKPSVNDAPSTPTLTSISLDQIAARWVGSPICGVCQDRPMLVMGEGGPNARIMFIGDGPALSLGAAGELLTKMIEAMGLKHEDVYLANLRECYPATANSILESGTCAELLDQQITAVHPEVIVALGEFAAERLIGDKVQIGTSSGPSSGQTSGKVRGQFQKYTKLDIPVLPTFHPGYLLEHAGAKRDAWEDLKAVAKHLGIAIPVKPSRNTSGKPTGRDST